jgi:kynureninase
MVLLDVYHHAGALPLDLATLDADFAVGGSYKYLRGGPGACWLYVHPRHHGLRHPRHRLVRQEGHVRLRAPDPPQFGPGGDAWLESTPPVLAPFQALAGLELALELGVERIREYNLQQKSFLRSLLPIQGQDERYGAFITLRHSHASFLANELEIQGVKTDARGEFLRLCPDILNSRDELERAAFEVSRILQSGR